MTVIESGAVAQWGPGLLILFAIPAILVALFFTKASLRRRSAMALVALSLVIIYGVTPLVVNSRVRGVVLGEDGRPVEATVVARNSRTNVEQVVRTDARGRFRVAIAGRAPEEHSLLLCSTRTEPLRVPQLPRNAIGSLRFTMWRLRDLSTDNTPRWAGRCADLLAGAALNRPSAAVYSGDTRSGTT